MTNGIQNVGGTITNIVGLGITLGALGLALEFADRSFDRATPRDRRTKRKPIFDVGNMDRMFEPFPPRKSRKRSNNVFRGDLF